MDFEKKYKAERKQVASFMRRLYKQGLTTTSGGNVSIRITDDIIGITSSATDKGRIKWHEVGLIDIFGENLTPDLKPSMEQGMHLAIYKKTKDIYAIIHAHPLFATAFTAMNLKIDTNLTAETRTVLGDPVFVPYALMGTKELADLAAANILLSDVLLLENHGIVTAGNDLLDAFNKIEILENAAKMTLLTESTKKKSPLTKSRILKLDKMFR